MCLEAGSLRLLSHSVTQSAVGEAVVQEARIVKEKHFTLDGEE